MIGEVIGGCRGGATAEGFPEEWGLDQLWRAFRQLYPGVMSIDEMIEEAGGDRAHLSADLITEIVTQDALPAYERREEGLAPEGTREPERRGAPPPPLPPGAGPPLPQRDPRPPHTFPPFPPTPPPRP